jgi:hypothetical protein
MEVQVLSPGGSLHTFIIDAVPIARPIDRFAVLSEPLSGLAKGESLGRIKSQLAQAVHPRIADAILILARALNARGRGGLPLLHTQNC